MDTPRDRSLRPLARDRGTTWIVRSAAFTLALSAAAPPLAAPPLWSISKIQVNGGLVGSGESRGYSVSCPSGLTPIAGHYEEFADFAPSSDFQRELEEVGYGSGGGYGVVVRSLSNSAASIFVTVYCVPVGYFSASDFKYGVYTANSSGIATEVSCSEQPYG